MDLSNLADWLQLFFYSELLMASMELAALIIGLKYVRKASIGWFFILYIAFDFCILMVDLYLKADITLSNNFEFYFVHTTNTLIAYVELLVYFYYFRKLLLKEKIKKILLGLTLLYTIIIIIFLITKFSFITSRYLYASYLTGAIEFIFLLFPCVYYYFQLFKTNSTFRLAERPSFWIVTGIFIYSLISIPYYLICGYFINIQYERRELFSAIFYYIPFTANFFFLIKAFLCKKALTT